MDFFFPAAAEKNRYFFLFCSANTSCKLKPSIFRYLNKGGKKNNSSGAVAGGSDAPGKAVGE